MVASTIAHKSVVSVAKSKSFDKPEYVLVVAFNTVGTVLAIRTLADSYRIVFENADRRHLTRVSNE